MPDPFGLDFGINVDPLAGLDFGFGGRKRAAYAPYTDLEEKDLLDTLLAKGTGALQYVGETLDKAGRASRGVIGGGLDLLQGNDPNWGGGLLNLIPLSDTMGLTDPKSQVEGRDILTKLGAPENKQGFHPIDDPLDALLDVGGLATEIALDPLSYVSPLAWTKSGKAALAGERKAAELALDSGKMLPEVARGIAPRIAAGERSLARIGLPDWLGGAGFDLGAGSETAAKFVGSTIDPAMEYLRKTRPVGMLSKMFETRAGNASNPELQQLFREKGANLVDDSVANATQPFFEDYDRLNRAGLIQNPEFIHRMRDAAEGLPSSWTGGSTLSDDKVVLAESFGRKTSEQFKGLVRDAQMRGINMHELEDQVVDYAARFHHADGKSGIMSNLLNNVRHAKAFVNRERAAMFKDIAGGTNGINEIAAGIAKAPNGQSIWDMPKEDAVEWLAPQFKVKPKPLEQTAEAMMAATEAAAEEAKERAGQLWSYVQNLDREAYDVAQAGSKAKKIFNGDVLQDGVLAASRSVKAKTFAELLHEATGTVAQAFPDGNKPADWVWVPQAHADWGLDFHEATRKKLSAKEGGGSILDTSKEYLSGQKRSAMYMNRAGKQIDPYTLARGDEVPWVTKTVGTETVRVPVGDSVSGMKYMAIPPDLHRDGLAMKNLLSSSDELKALGAAFDGLQGIWKTSVTSVWPSFHARNALGGLFYHWMSGAAGGPLGNMKPFTEAMSILRGGKVAPETLSALRLGDISDVVGELRAHKILKSGVGSAAETMTGPELARTAMQGHVPSQAVGPVDMVTGGVANTARRGAESFAARTGESGRLMKAAIAADEVAGGIADIGRKTGDFVEDTLRVGHYLAQRANGLSPADAASSVRKYFFDFSEVTPMEKSVMRRIFPFYTWTKKNTPLVLKEVLQNPGGKLAQSVRAVNEPRDRDGYIPEWVGQGGAAIPTGKEGRFVTSLGLPFESAFNWNVSPTVGKTIQRNVEQTVGAMNPLIRTGYTAASGRDPFSGRAIDELYAYPTNIPLVNALVANSPGSRAVSTARRLTDERKDLGTRALDLLTGVKVTDVSGGLENAKEQEGRKALEELMRARPELKQFTTFYADPTIPKDTLPPTVGEMLRLNATIIKHGKEKAKKKRQNKLTEQQELLITPQGGG
jgi:hypothetical protein